MLYLAIKALVSGAIIAAASEVAKRYSGFGVLIASLPLVSDSRHDLAVARQARCSEHGRPCGRDLLVCAPLTADIPAHAGATESRRAVLASPHGGGLLTIAFLAALHLESGTLTPPLKGMEGAGLVARQRATTDERRVLESLTKHGAALREPAREVPKALAKSCRYPPASWSSSA